MLFWGGHACAVSDRAVFCHSRGANVKPGIS